MDPNQDTLYDELAEQLTQLGVHDAVDLADRMKLELDPSDPLPHPASLLHLAHSLCLAPLGGEDGFGDLRWQIEQGREAGSLRLSFEHDNETSAIELDGPFRPDRIEQAFLTAEHEHIAPFDYVMQQDEEDTAALWIHLAEDCQEYQDCLASAQKLRKHPRLPELFLDAVAHAHDNAIADALELGVDPNAVDNRLNTALHIAARNGHTHLIQPLVHAGARVDAVNCTKFTPLHLAAQMAHPDTCLALIACNASTDKLDAFGRTPLRLAKDPTHEQRQDL